MRIDYSPFFSVPPSALTADSACWSPPPSRVIRPITSNAATRTITPRHRGGGRFAAGELTVDVKDRVLTIAGKREDTQEKSNFLHQGIAGRGFERNFQLAEHVEVKGARLENGLLQIDLERIVPEEKKPRRIAINAPAVSNEGLKTIEGSKAAA